MTGARMRPAWVWLHRWVGLVTALFLLLAGLTGSVLVWYPELDRFVASRLHEAPSTQPALDPLLLRERVAAAYPAAAVNHVELRIKSGRTLAFYLEAAPDPAAKAPVQLLNDEVFVDPATGEIVGERRWGALSQGRVNLMPFIYQLHYKLALGELGLLLMGLIALLWTIDCVVSLLLTLPRRNTTGSSTGFWRRYGPAWKIRLGSGVYRLCFDLHRAGGLWTWAMLFILAWSSVAFNLNEVYHPVMKLFLPMEDRNATIPARAAPLVQPTLSWRQALQAGRAHMQTEGRRLGFTVDHEEGLSYDAGTGTYRYRVRSSADIRDEGGSTSVYVDGTNGRLLHTSLPTGLYAGTTVTTWLMTLHVANVWGLPFRLFVCAMGLLVAALSLTGILIWWRKRRGRLAGESTRRGIDSAADA